MIDNILTLDLDKYTDPQVGLAVMAYFLVCILALHFVISRFDARKR